MMDWDVVANQKDPFVCVCKEIFCTFACKFVG